MSKQLTIKSLKKTIHYSAFFDSPLTLKELHLWLISPHQYSTKQITSLLKKQPSIKKLLVSSSHPLRQTRQKLTTKKLKPTPRLVSFLKLFPTIQLIALTGSLAVNNAKQTDDIDLLIITAPHTLWLTRLIAIPLISLLFHKRQPQTTLHQQDTICINLWLDQNKLMVLPKKQNLYTAHEVLQTKPLFDRGGVFHQFIKDNHWTKKYLANAYHQKSKTLTKKNYLNNFLTPIFTILLFLPNLLAFLIQRLYMQSKMTNEAVSLHFAYFHPRNLYPKIKHQLEKI